MVALATSRLNLRRLTGADLDAVSALNADPDVMRYFPSCLTAEQSAAFIERVDSSFDTDGIGWFAVEWRDTREFAGCVGLLVASFEAAFTPCVEVGWRICRRFWGCGVATEAARAVVRWAFDEKQLPEVVSFTYVNNVASRRVMEKLGMSRDPLGDFEHPRLPVGHWLRPHVLYRARAVETGWGSEHDQ